MNHTDDESLSARAQVPHESTPNAASGIRDGLRFVAFYVAATGGIAGARRAASLWDRIEPTLLDVLGDEPQAGPLVTRLGELLGPAAMPVEQRAQRFTLHRDGYVTTATLVRLLDVLGADLDAEGAWEQRSEYGQPPEVPLTAETLAELDRLRTEHEAGQQ